MKRGDLRRVMIVVATVGIAGLLFALADHSRNESASRTECGPRDGGSHGPDEREHIYDGDAEAAEEPGGPHLAGPSREPRVGADARRKREMWGVGVSNLQLALPMFRDKGILRTTESWSVSDAGAACGAPSALANPGLVWTCPASRTGPHFEVAVSRNIVGPYDGAFYAPRSVMVLEGALREQGIVVEPSSAPVDASAGAVLHQNGSSWTLVGTIEDWGTSISDYSCFAFGGLAGASLPLTVTVCAQYEDAARTQRFRFTHPLQDLRVARLVDAELRPTDSIRVTCRIAYLEGVGRIYVQTLDEGSDFVASEIRVGGEPFHGAIPETVENATVEVMSEHASAVASRPLRLCVDDGSGTLWSIRWAPGS